MMIGFIDDRARNSFFGFLLFWGVLGIDLVCLGIISEVFEEEEDFCVICYEEMIFFIIVMLECKYRFYDEVRDVILIILFS